MADFSNRKLGCRTNSKKRSILMANNRLSVALLFVLVGCANNADSSLLPRPLNPTDGLRCAKPNWPQFAEHMNASGVTEFKFTVCAAGYVSDIELLRSSGPTTEHRLLDLAAKQSLQYCTFPRANGYGPVSTTIRYSWEPHLYQK